MRKEICAPFRNLTRCFRSPRSRKMPAFLQCIMPDIKHACKTKKMEEKQEEENKDEWPNR